MVSLGTHRCVKHWVTVDSIDGGVDLLEGEGLRRLTIEIIRLRTLPLSPGSDLGRRYIQIRIRGSRVTVPLFLTHHWIIQIRWWWFAHLAPAGRVKNVLRGRVQRGSVVEGVHRMWGITPPATATAMVAAQTSAARRA